MSQAIRLDRRKFLIGSGLAGTTLAMPSVLRGAAPPPPVAECAQGRLRGLSENGVNIFRGIPYAGSVSGETLRFRAPPPPVSWAGTRDATRFGPPAIQPPGQSFGIGAPEPSEDCLVLNVWTPGLDGRKRPVMFYCHGGGFMIGSGGAPWQDGSNLAREHDVVVIQSNHRLGAMGYLYLGQLLGPEYAGNQGLQDLVAALSWVRTNIGQFGGDPANVTIFGESGGGGKVSCLYGMPSASALFAKASIESPIGPGDNSPEAATEVTREVMRRIGITDPRALLTVPAAQILKAQMGEGPSAAPGTIQPGDAPRGRPEMMFWPFIDGTLLPEEPFKAGAPVTSAHKPLIVGSCRDEAVFFNRLDKTAFQLNEAGLKARLAATLGDRAPAWIEAFRKSRPNASPSQLFMAITTAKPWRAQAVRIAEQKAAQGAAPVYSYILDYRAPDVVPGTDYPEGSPHASDIAMKFDTAAQFGPKHPERLQTARNMSSLWANFARTGVPSAAAQPAWPAYTLERRETMIIDARCRVELDPEREDRLFWDKEPGSNRIA